MSDKLWFVEDFERNGFHEHDKLKFVGHCFKVTGVLCG